MRRVLYLCVAGVLIGCERSQLSPVDIKVDEDMGYTAVGDIALGAAHKVSNDETLFDVANKYNVDPINLAKINGIKHPYNVKNGQILRLPTEDSPQKEDEEENKEKENILVTGKVKKNEIDDEFADMMKSADKKSQSGASFNEQENSLSVPKVTQSTSGTPVAAAQSPALKLKSPVVASKGMIRPVDGKIISRFGDVKDGISNDGINIKAPLGTPVKASAGGDVIYAGNKLEEFGNTVIIRHDNGLITSYAHLNDIRVKNGTSVSPGDIIGSVGETGDVAGPQLHFEILKDKTPVDPSEYLK